MAKADPTVEIPVDMDFEEKALNIPLGTYVQFVFTLPTVLTFFIFVPWNRTSQERTRGVPSNMRGLRARVGCSLNRRPAK